MKLRNLAALGCIATILVACGGGGGGGGDLSVTPGGGSPTDTGSVPASVLASVDAFVAYLRQLGADETSEPLTLPNAVPPTSDAIEPA